MQALARQVWVGLRTCIPHRLPVISMLLAHTPHSGDRHLRAVLLTPGCTSESLWELDKRWCLDPGLERFIPLV